MDLARLTQSGLLGAMRRHFGRSFLALIIKVSTAGLTYLMFVALSRLMGEADYGQFAFGFALATILAIGAGVGQHMSILRLWPEFEAKGEPDRSLLAQRTGWVLTSGAGLMISTGLALVGLISFGITGDGLYLVAAAALVLPMALAEYLSAVLRAQGSVIAALVPRDIGWRALVPGLALIAGLLGLQMSGSAALLAVALVLVAMLGVQGLVSWQQGFQFSFGFRGIGNFLTTHWAMVVFVWVATLLDTAALNLDIVLVGLFLGPESSGLFLNAFRTAGLMTLFLFAINQVVAPMVARHYHAGEMDEAQSLSAFAAWAGFVFSLVVFGTFLLYGELVMSLFGPSYSNGVGLLLILSGGLMIDAATGPTRIVMMMTGHEKSYVAILGVTSLVALVGSVIAIIAYGIIGAALVNAAARIITQITLVVRTRQLTGIDPSILGLRGPARPDSMGAAK